MINDLSKSIIDVAMDSIRFVIIGPVYEDVVLPTDKDSHYKNNMVVRPSYLYSENTYTWKDFCVSNGVTYFLH